MSGANITAAVVLTGARLELPDAVICSGDWEVYFLAVCSICDDMVMPFGTRVERNTWAAKHPHPIAFGLEVRQVF